jgi:hypothetical protein
MKSREWKTYRTRFLVKAKQLNSTLSFTDHLGRQHCGRRGDYLVESCDGVLSIAPRRIFEDIYVPMGLTPSLPHINEEVDARPAGQDSRYEPLIIEKVKSSFHRESQRVANLEGVVRIRKSPQTVPLTPSRLGLM